ncbi:MAG: Beta-hexosaminidase [Ktedonobacterales bacterium]|nr:MAG: Beta-hexosaminidase [Ktedonobacterales bacterium]
MHSYHRVGKSLVAAGILVVALVVALVAVVPSIPAEATQRTASGAAVEQSKVILRDTSSDGPALWTSNPSTPHLGLASVLAWIGTDAGHSLNIMQSSDGVTYGGKVTFAESSATRPAVAAQGPPTTIVLAWTGTDANHSLNLLCQGSACGASAGSFKKLTLNETSFTSPALVRFGNGFLLAWAGTDANHSLNILPFSLTTSGSGFQLGTKSILRQFGSVSMPSLALNPLNNQLLLSWAATSPANQLAFATSSDGVSWSQAQTLGETSAVGPSGFAVADTTMPTYWMAWTGTNVAHSVSVRFTPNVSQWPLSNKTTLGEAAFGGPALGYGGNVGQTLLAWTGTDSAHHLNIATLTTATPTLDQRIDTYIAGLSTTQLIGQTLMMSVCTASYNANIDQALKQWDVGSAIIYTSCNGGPTEPPTAAGLQQLDQTMQSNANHAGSLLLGIDEEGGTVDRLAPYFGPTPSARQLAATGNPQNAYAQAQTDAGRMSSLGLNVDFAPVVDVDQGGGEGPSRMFGTTVGTVTTYAGAFLSGLQQHGVAGTLKHWPGLGAATGNPDNTLPTINQSQAQMNAIDFPPFGALLYQQPGMIMVTTVMVPAFDSHSPAILSSTLVTGILRGQLGYQGVVITDALGAQGLLIYMKQQGYSDPTQAIAEASVRAFLAGDDLLLCPLAQTDLQAVVTAMTQAVASGRISQAQLHAAVHRIIRLKVELGLIALP